MTPSVTLSKGDGDASALFGMLEWRVGTWGRGYPPHARVGFLDRLRRRSPGYPSAFPEASTLREAAVIRLTIPEMDPDPLHFVARMGMVLVFAVVAWTGADPATAQRSVRFETHVSSDSVAVGERFTLSLIAEHGPQTAVSFPSPDAGGVLFGDLEVIQRLTVQQRPAPAGRQVDSVAYEVTTFALDSVRVPALPVRVTAGRDTTIRSAPARTVTVVSVVGPDAKGMHGVAALAPFPQPLWTWALLALVGAGLLGGLAYLWWRRRRQDDDPTPVQRIPDDDQTPYEAATSWIRQLEESYDLADPDAVKPFYVELSNALRIYLARELGVAALERTTREVVDTLEERPDVPAAATSRIQAVLQLADLAKFAGIRPTTDDHEKALREARAALDTIEAAPRSTESDAIDGVASAA